MRRRSALLLIIALPIAAGSWPQNPGIRLPDDPLQGRSLFEARGCFRCHGVGDQGPNIGPNLGGGGFEGTFMDLGAAMWNHVPGMSVTFEATGTAWPELDETEVVQLLTFLNAIEYLGRPGDPEVGEQVFDQDGCSSCHLIGGNRAGGGPDLAGLQYFASPLSVAQAIWNHGPRMLQQMSARGLAPPSFGEGDLADLSAFVRREASPSATERRLLAPGNPNRGATLFSSKGCARCHGQTASGGSGGPDLSQFDLHQSAANLAGQMWNHALGMRTAMEARGMSWPQLEGTELADLVAFLYFIPFVDPAGDPARGEGVFSSRSCITCHGVGGEEDASGAATVSDLRTSAASASPAALVTAMWNHAPVMKEAILREGRHWPEFTGADLRDLLAYLAGSH